MVSTLENRIEYVGILTGRKQEDSAKALLQFVFFYSLKQINHTFDQLLVDFTLY